MNMHPHPGRPPASGRRTPFLGVTYDPLTLDEALAAVVARGLEAPFAAVVTPNADHLVRIANSGGEIARAYEDAWLCLNDSRVVGFIARLMGVRLPTVPGADLVRDLFDGPHLDPDWPILLVGGRPQTFALFVEKYGLRQAVHHDAPMGLLHDRAKFDATVTFVEAHPARFVLLAVGSPQQELLAQALKRRARATGTGLCIGAAVDFLVYPKRRAPAWISRIGLEWLFRLLCEPRRLWRRYLVNSPQLLRLWIREWRGRKGRAG